MIMTVTETMFRDAFRTMGRTDQFTYAGLNVLYEYLENLSEDTGEEVELDVIAICCDYYEDTPKAILENYGVEVLEDYGINAEDIEDMSDDELMDAVVDYLNDETIVVGTTDNTIVYMAF